MSQPDPKDQSSTPAVWTDLAIKAGVGVTVASITNPFLGAVVALAPDACKAIHTVLRDFVLRPESPRRSSRALLATECIVKGIAEKLKDGYRIRDDGFFEPELDRSKAEELYEAVLDACIRQFEEKKISHIAKIYEYAVFRDIPTSTVNSLLQQASEKTWRHYCLLSLLSHDATAACVSSFFSIPESMLNRHSDEPHLRSDLERLHGRATGLITEVSGLLQLSINGNLFVDCAGIADINDDEMHSIRATMQTAIENHRSHP
jgi:hypothetical protein